MSAEYTMGWDDAKSGKSRRESEPMADMLLNTVSLGTINDDFDYEEYNRGYDDAEADSQSD